MIVLGIDPGTRHFGWGVVARTGTRLTHVAHGVIEAGMKAPLGERLVVIEKELERIVRTHGATAASIEGIFFAKDASAACKLGHARGVALLVCVRAGLEIGEYPPSRAKRAVTGSGRADKSQVALMIRAILCLPAVPPSDAADALALAVTHLQRMPISVRSPLRPASKGLDPIKPRKPLPASPLRVNPPPRRVVQRP